MASLNAVLEGLQIFAEHGLGNAHSVAAEHDEFFVFGKMKTPLTAKEKKRLDALGWFPTDEPEEGEEPGSWKIFV